MLPPAGTSCCPLAPSLGRTVDRMSDGVLLTGATGFVGMELLARYLERTDRRVYALVRGADDREAAARIAAHAAVPVRSRAPLCASAWSRVRGDLTRPGLGAARAARPAGRAHQRDRARRGVGVVRARAAGRARDQRRRHAARCSSSPSAATRAAACGASPTSPPRTSPASTRACFSEDDLDVGPALSQRLRAVEVRGREPGRTLRACACRSRCCARASSSASATAAGRRRSTCSTGRCARSRAAPTRRCPRAARRPSTSCRSTTSPTRLRPQPGAGGRGRDVPPHRRAAREQRRRARRARERRSSAARRRA